MDPLFIDLLHVPDSRHRPQAGGFEGTDLQLFKVGAPGVPLIQLGQVLPLHDGGFVRVSASSDTGLKTAVPSPELQPQGHRKR
jgi:hypothetical protein